MKLKILLFFFTVYLVSTVNLIAQSGDSTNFLIYPSTVTQTEPVLTVSPKDPNFIFASAVTINTSIFFKSEGVYLSTDGGLQWSGSDTCNGQLLTNHGGDPQIMINQNNRLILTHIGSIYPGIFSHYSDDSARTAWSNAATITQDQVEDKGTATIDNNPGSPYYGRLYAVWVSYSSPYFVYSSYANSTDNTQSWSTKQAVNTQASNRCSGGSIIVSKDGTVYVCWAGVDNGTPPKEILVGFSKSTDGGVSWQSNQNIYAMNGINGTLPEKNNIRVNSLPQIAIDSSGGPRDGWLYIVTTEKNLAPAGSDPDIILHRSTDGGTTWSPGIRVNQDPLNDGKIQYFPAMTVDENGWIDMIYYDDRNTTSDSAEVYMARSSDGGDTWTENVLSDHRFKPVSIAGGPTNYQGDHIAILAVGDKLYSSWMDNYSGIYQIWMKIKDITITSVKQNQIAKLNFHLNQNYPNPFNPSTKISWTLKSREFVTLKIYNSIGQEISTLIKEEQNPGSHQIQFDATNLSSGIYFYELRAGTNKDVKKMLLLR